MTAMVGQSNYIPCRDPHPLKTLLSGLTDRIYKPVPAKLPVLGTSDGKFNSYWVYPESNP